MAAIKKQPRKTYTAQQIGGGLVRASYDVARTTDETKNLWTNVDALSAAAANSPSVRKIVRERARYECANNSYADGMMDTLASDTIGGEIHIQLGDSELAQQIEMDFQAWAREVKLFQKLRTMCRSKHVDGESFAKIGTNRKLRNAVKLDIWPFECDLVESWAASTRSDEIDGIRFDESQNPTEYRVLNQHPGDHRISLKSLSGEWVKARYILHYFTDTRPGQVRGISSLLPALSLFGQLRLFTAAVLSGATRAAEITAVMQTTMTPDAVAADVEAMATIEAQRNMITSIPEGWTLSQLKAEQPVTTYAMFKRELINEAARCISMPYNVAACDSSSYNYASGRLDHQTYDRSIETERQQIRSDLLDPVFREWLAEYAIAKQMTAQQVESAAYHEWYFSGRGHVDPNKEASADDTRFRNGSLTKAVYYSKQGADWQTQVGQRIKEMVFEEKAWNDERKKAGLDPAPYPGGATRSMTIVDNQNQGDSADEK